LQETKPPGQPPERQGGAAQKHSALSESIVGHFSWRSWQSPLGYCEIECNYFLSAGFPFESKLTLVLAGKSSPSIVLGSANQQLINKPFS
jgi:hypothetical protein